MRPVVCIGFAEALSAPEAAWSLADSGCLVVAFARRGRSSALRRSRHVRLADVTAPESDFSATLRELEELLNSWQSAGSKRVVLPLDDAAVWLFNQLKHDSGWSLAGPQGKNADLALDKWMQVQNAARAGFKVPETILALSVGDVISRVDLLPVILKPANAVLPRGGLLQKGRYWICGNRQELERAVNEWEAAFPLLVQSFIRGTGEGVFGLASDAGIQAWSAHRRLRMMNPHGSGSSACTSQPVPESLKRPAAEFIQGAGWRGLFMLEFLRGQDGTPWFVEFNGRTWGSTALSRRQGLEYPAWAVHLALHPHASVVPPEDIARSVICRHAGREFMHLLFVLRGPRSEAVKDWPGFWRTLMEVLRVGRGRCLYNWRMDDKRVFLSDVWCTIRASLFKSRN